MSKKKKKKKDGPKPLISKKLKRRVFRSLIIFVIASLGYMMYNPNVIQDEESRDKIINLRDKILSLTNSSQEKLVEVAPQAQKLSSVVTKIPVGDVLGDQDVYVEDIVKQASTQLEKLPYDSFQRFRTDFCADLVYNATQSATTSNTD